MTTTVVLLSNVRGENGQPWKAGDTKTCSDSFADMLIGRGDAYDSFAQRLDIAPGVEKLLPIPALLDAYNVATGSYTFAGTPASSALRSTTDPAPWNSGITFTSGVGSSSTTTIGRAMASPVTPNHLGVVAFLMRVTGKKNSRLITMTNASAQSGNVILADNATTPLMRDGAWMWVAAHISEFGSNINSATTQLMTPKIGVQLTSSSGADQTVVDVRYALANAAGRPTVNLTFDDITSDQFDIAFPIMRARGLVGTVYVPKDYVGTAGHMTVDQLKTLKDAGWSICVDSTTDDQATSTTVATAVDGINANRDFVLANGLAANGSENHGCWTFGTWNEANAAAMEAAGMETMRGTSGSMLGTNLKYTVFDRFGVAGIAMTMPSFTGGGTSPALLTDYATAKSAIDLAVTRGSHLPIHFHTFVESGADSSTKTLISVFTQVCDYLQSLQTADTLTVLNKTDWWDGVKRATRPPFTV